MWESREPITSGREARPIRRTPPAACCGRRTSPGVHQLLRRSGRPSDEGAVRLADPLGDAPDDVAGLRVPPLPDELPHLVLELVPEALPHHVRGVLLRVHGVPVLVGPAHASERVPVDVQRRLGALGDGSCACAGYPVANLAEGPGH